MQENQVTPPNDAVRAYLSQIGRKGGAAGRGASKARTSEQARAAARAKWTKWKRYHEAARLKPPATIPAGAGPQPD